MKIAMVGLGRMGGNMTRRLAGAGHQVVAYDQDPAAASALASEHEAIEAAASLPALVTGLPRPRIVWVMVPAGAATTATVEDLAGRLEEGDIIVNGGNCRWTDSVAYHQTAMAQGVAHLDAGVSGGVWGLEAGYCLMVGGPAQAYAAAQPIFEALAPPDGTAHVGGAGAGHFAKMAHNGIEYALLQSFAEGFELLHESDYDYDLGQVAQLWRHGSVVRSWLLDLLADVLDGADADLAGIAAYVEDSGEGRWTVEAGVSHAVPTPAIASALYARFASRRSSFGDRLIAALRQQFGGHAVKEDGGG